MQSAKFVPKAYTASRRSLRSVAGSRYRSGPRGYGGLTVWEWCVVVMLVVGVVGLVIFAATRGRRKTVPHAVLPTTTNSNTNNETTIFVSVPAYRDAETATTLLTLFAHASHPRRVKVGLCQFSAGSDVDAIDAYQKLCDDVGLEKRYFDNIRVLRRAATDARGPAATRHAIETQLYGGEDFVLQVDSHTRFAPGWDDVLLADWHVASTAMATPKVVLTTQPSPYARTDDPLASTPAPTLPSFLMPHGFDKLTGLPMFAARRVALAPTRHYLQLGFGAGFAFYPGRRIAEVPYLASPDPNTPFPFPYLFFGEEFAMGALLATGGWSLVMPTSTPATALHTRAYRPTFWEIMDEDAHLAKIKGAQDLNTRLRDKASGVNLAGWEAYLGVSLLDKTVEPMAAAGISPEASQEEVVAKYGSVTALKAATESP